MAQAGCQCASGRAWQLLAGTVTVTVTRDRPGPAALDSELEKLSPAWSFKFVT